MTKTFLFLLIIPLMLLSGFLVYSKFAGHSTKALLAPINDSIEQAAPRVLASPTPFPFQELTVPYLREKKYDSSLGEMQKVSENATYTSYLTSFLSDGLKVNGLLTVPKGEGKYPAIVFVHGYIPPNSYQTTQNYASFVDFLARNGLVVFKIDLRGHGDSEGEAGGGYYSSDYIVDTLSAVSALNSADFVNPGKVGLWGHSMAGNVVLRSMAVKPEIPAAVVWAGAGFSYLDLAEFGISDNSYQAPQDATERQQRRQLLRDTYGNPADGDPFWKLVAATSYLNDFKGAIQLHHAVDDNVVNVGYSRNLDQLLDDTSVPHELYEYQSGGHNLTGGSFTSAMQRTVEFFQNHLK